MTQFPFTPPLYFFPPIINSRHRAYRDRGQLGPVGSRPDPVDRQWELRDKAQNARNDMRANIHADTKLRHYASEVK